MREGCQSSWCQREASVWRCVAASKFTKTAHCLRARWWSALLLVFVSVCCFWLEGLYLIVHHLPWREGGSAFVRARCLFGKAGGCIQKKKKEELGWRWDAKWLTEEARRIGSQKQPKQRTSWEWGVLVRCIEENQLMCSLMRLCSGTLDVAGDCHVFITSVESFCSA